MEFGKIALISNYFLSSSFKFAVLLMLDNTSNLLVQSYTYCKCVFENILLTQEDDKKCLETTEAKQ